MNLQSPFEVVTPTVDGDVLGVVALTEAEFTSPEVHRLIGARSADGVRRALERLTDQGIVIRRRAGNAWLYRFNTQHITAAPIRELARSRERLLERTRDVLAQWAVPCEFGALFGSAARGQMTTASDIDVFIVRPDGVSFDDGRWENQRFALSEQISSWTGNAVNVLELSVTELLDALTLDDNVVLDVRDHGVCLAGPSNYMRCLRRSQKRTANNSLGA